MSLSAYHFDYNNRAPQREMHQYPMSITPTGTQQIAQPQQQLLIPSHEEPKIYALVIDLMDPTTRETALLELSKKREQYDDLALVLWHSFGM